MNQETVGRLLRVYGPVIGLENVTFHLSALRHVMGKYLTLGVAVSHLEQVVEKSGAERDDCITLCARSLVDQAPAS
jgi:hypothetical protein